MEVITLLQLRDYTQATIKLNQLALNMPFNIEEIQAFINSLKPHYRVN